MSSRRKKRSIKSINVVANEASAAAFSLYRGFLNSQSVSSTNCAAQFMCEGSALASTQGEVGKKMAYFAGYDCLKNIFKRLLIRY